MSLNANHSINGGFYPVVQKKNRQTLKKSLAN